jgi:hypothetical protein
MTLRINHMELTFKPGTLTDVVRSEIGIFYGNLLGIETKEVSILGQNALLMNLDEEGSQFILCAESPKYLHSPGYDHLGLHLDTREAVDDVLSKAKALQIKDDRIFLKEYQDLKQGRATVHAFYIKHLLPIWFDIQVIEFEECDSPSKCWTFAEVSK